MQKTEEYLSQSKYAESGLKEIIILVILGCLAAWGTYSLGVWLVGGFK